VWELDSSHRGERRIWSASGDHAYAHRVDGNLHGTVKIQFLDDVSPMRLDGACTDTEEAGTMMGNAGDTREAILRTAWFVRSVPEIRYAPAPSRVRCLARRCGARQSRESAA